MMTIIIAILYRFFKFILQPFRRHHLHGQLLLQQKQLVSSAIEETDWDDNDTTTARHFADATEETSSSSSSSSSSSECASSKSDSIIAQFHPFVRVNLCPRKRRLVVTNFIANCSTKDEMLLLELCKDCQSSLNAIIFHDTIPGAGYRRWFYKKTGVHRRFMDNHQVGIITRDVQFHTTVEITCSPTVAASSAGGCMMSPKAIVSLLGALKTDQDVKSIVFTGCLGFHDAIYIICNGLKSLLEADHRHWQRVCLEDLDFIKASSPKEALLARKYCQRTLHKVATQRYINNIQI